jgi:homoserine kinase type II
MLWEKTDPLSALRQRFRFDDVEAAGRWLADLLGNSYGIAVDGVDRIVISAGNLLAWLHTPDGRVIAKCCAYPGIHERRTATAELLTWVHDQGIPVSAPVRARDGALQVERDHLSVGVQHVVRGELLDLTDPMQSRIAGEMLAGLHWALADYPPAADLMPGGRPEPKVEFGDWLHNADIADANLRLLIERRLDELDKIDTQLVHFDYRSANVLTAAGKIIAILDFEEVQPLPRVADAAHSTVFLGCRYHDWAPTPVDTVTTFLDAYEQRADLDINERNWLRLFQLRYAIDAGPRWQGMVERLAVG